MNQRIRNHKLYSASDYRYLRRKGYSDADIFLIWNRDYYKLGIRTPLTHKPMPKIQKYFSTTLQKWVTIPENKEPK